MSNFEDLSDEIIISILEYLNLEDFIALFGQLNTRLTYLTLEHPWVQRHFNIHSIDNQTLQQRLEYLENFNLISHISTLQIRPFSIFGTIEKFHEYKSIRNFVQLRALSLKQISLEETELIFTPANLLQLPELNRICLTFSFVQHANDYSLRLETIIASILNIQSLEYCQIESARSITFTQIKSHSNVQYFDINYTNLQSLYRLFQYTPILRCLIAKIAIHNDSNIEQSTIIIPLTLRSLKLTLAYPAFDELTKLLENLSKLEQFHLITHSIIEPMNLTLLWSKLIHDYLRALTQFKRQSSVPIEQIEEYIQAHHWTNGWQCQEKISPQSSNYSRVKIINTRY